MPLTFPTLNDLSAQAQAELRRQLPSVDPTIQGSFAKALLDTTALQTQTGLLIIRDLAKQYFPQTAEGEFLDLWGGYENLPRKAASPAIGVVAATGTNGSVIPSGTQLSRSGVIYQTTAVAVISVVSQSVSSLTRTGTTAIATTPADHSLSSGLSVTISGATQTEYNGTFEIVVTARNQFQYTVSGSPVSPATGTIGYAATYAPVQIESTSTGQATNAPAGGVFAFTSAPAGVNSSATAGIDGISGGAAVENDEDYRARILLSRSIQEGVFTSDQVKLAALGVAGNTRAFVVTPSLSVCGSPGPGMIPVPGQTVVYILRDNDVNPIPTQTVLNSTKTAILANGRLPANTWEGDVYVFAPVPVSVPFVFSSITPDTPTMRSAITAQLQAFFEDTVDFEETVREAAYLGAIQNTVDTTTGAALVSFALSSPTADVTVSAGQIAVFGGATYP